MVPSFILILHEEHERTGARARRGARRRLHNLATPEEKPLLDRLLRVKRANQLKRYGAGEIERKEAEAAR